MLISLAAVPKTGGGKYANLCSISMLCITSVNLTQNVASVPLQELSSFPPEGSVSL